MRNLVTAIQPHPPLLRDSPGFLLLRRIDAFIFPPLCIVCDQPRLQSERWLCPACLASFVAETVNRNVCVRCGIDHTRRTCACNVVWDLPFDRIISFVNYGDMVQTLMHHVKYQGKKHLARYLGALCASELVKAVPAGFDCAIPIPLHWVRRKKRGYNQAEWFARGLFGPDSGTVVDCTVLRRIRGTKTQTQLDKSERLGNIAGAFALAPGGAALIAGKRVALVDDVVTTGATTASAAQALLAGGCAQVTVISLARD